MRTLCLLRGSAGVGKSTFIKENNLQQYTLCADEIRLMFQSPILDISGSETISQKNDKRVWEFLFKLLEERMKRGEFTVIDATHSTQKAINQYRELAIKYRYRVFAVDFTDVPIEETKRRNLQRPQYKQVPEQAIDMMYSRFETQKTPTWVTTVKPQDIASVLQFKPLDFSDYKKVHVIGDVHGCYSALANYILRNDGLKSDELFIFCGDYCDRGIENALTMKFLTRIIDRENVICLEGNHEIHLWKWANDEPSVSEEFEARTRVELENGGVSKSEVRQFYRKLRQCAYFAYHDKTILVTHGGLSTLPQNLTFVATEQLIKGVGVYADAVDEKFAENTSTNVWQVHGHRNVQEYPIMVTGRTANLEGKVELGGALRVITFSENGKVETHYIDNENYNADRFKKNETIKPIEVDNKTFLEGLRGSSLVQEKELEDNISSFNFKNSVFYDKLWDKQPATLKARGLFINTSTTEIVARSYNKFFNINEREDVKIENLNNILTFPIKTYVKENGYLGILGYNSETDRLVIASKSTTKGDYAEWFKNLFYKTLYNTFGHSELDKRERELKDFLKDNNCTMVFEVIDMEHDPHIIQYPKSKLVLLDIVYRTPIYKKMEYEAVVQVGEKFGFKVKKLLKTIENWQDFLGFYNVVTSETYSFSIDGEPIEGFVFEDANGFMTKVKLHYYNFWKHMRGVKDKISRPNTIINQSALTTPLANEFYGWLKGQDAETLKKDIITLRKEFYKTRG